MEKIVLADLAALAQNVLARVMATPHKNAATIVALSGDLGAGKTTFTQTLARGIGIDEHVQSPTYVLMKSYSLAPGAANPRFDTFVHIDAYRLENAGEFKALKPELFLNDPKALVVIEWPERVEGVLPQPDLVLKFSSEDAGEGERYIGGV